MRNRTTPHLRIYPVVIGINHYSDSRFETLDYAINDATRFDQFLTDGNVAFTIVDKTLLLDAAATGTTVLRALQEWEKKTYLGANDLLLLYFAGHGMVSSALGGRVGVLCCQNADMENPNTNTVNLEQLFRTIQQSEASVMVIIDACESGSLLDPGVVQRDPGQELRQALGAFIPAASRGNRIIITAAGTGKAARESSKLGSGLLTHAVLQGWQQAEAQHDGTVTPLRLQEYLYDHFDRAGRQRPVMSMTGEQRMVILQVAAQVLRDQPASSVIGVVNPGLLVDRATPSPQTFNVAHRGSIPLAQSRSRQQQPQRLALMIAAVMAVVIALSGILAAAVPFVFAVGFILACVMTLAAVLVMGVRWRLLFGALAVVQAILLLGVAHTHFNLGHDVKVLGSIANFASVALFLFIVQSLAVTIKAVDTLTSH